MNRTTRSLVLSALFLALALILPFLTMQIREIGEMLLPMHLPVLLCGFLVGAPWGLLVGLIAPILRSVLFGMPPMFPDAAAMAFELAAYGFFSGLLFRALPKKPIYLYVALILSMLLGRIVWGLAMYALLAAGGGAFGLAAFWSRAFATAWPGMIVQLLLVPACVGLAEKGRLGHAADAR